MPTTDNTRLDIPVPTDSTSASSPAPTAHTLGSADHQPLELAPPPRWSRRLLAVALVIVTAVLTFAGASTLADLGDAAPAEEAPEIAEVGDGATPDTSIPADEPSAGAPSDPPAGPPVVEPVPQAEEHDEDPVADPEPSGPCDLLAPGRTLAVTAGPVELPPGTYAGELIVTNCSGDPVPWSATTLAPSVTLGVANGVLAGGAQVDVQFSVDPSAIVGSALAFFITVDEPGFDTQVMVQVTKVIVNPGLLPPGQELAP